MTYVFIKGFEIFAPMVGGSQIALFTQPYKERYALQSRKVEGRERETKGVSNRSVNTKKGNWSVARKRTNRGDGDDDQRAVNFRGLSGKEREGGAVRKGLHGGTGRESGVGSSNDQQRR